MRDGTCWASHMMSSPGPDKKMKQIMYTTLLAVMIDNHGVNRTKAGLQLAHRRRRWANCKTASTHHPLIDSDYRLVIPHHWSRRYSAAPFITGCFPSNRTSVFAPDNLSVDFWSDASVALSDPIHYSRYVLLCPDSAAICFVTAELTFYNSFVFV